MTPTTASGNRRPATGDGAPLDGDQTPDSPLEGTSSIVRSAAADAARFVTAPARVAARAAGPIAAPLLRAGAQAGLGLAGRLAGRLFGGGGDDEAPQPPPPTRSADGDARPAPSRSTDSDTRREADADAVEEARRHGAAAATAPPPAAATPPAPAEPIAPAPIGEDHVSEEAVVVAEFAERGAEDGAGSEVTVAQPWDGYADQPANEIVRRLASASPEELAAVQLYEGFGRKRRTVMDAAERRLRATSS